MCCFPKADLLRHAGSSRGARESAKLNPKARWLKLSSSCRVRYQHEHVGQAYKLLERLRSKEVSNEKAR